ncbi:hypothetical protein PIB30_069791, partial [Stylosanthes scabra]|nr:hypothetical protein [Stylosanthes scabra]
LAPGRVRGTERYEEKRELAVETLILSYYRRSRRPRLHLCRRRQCISRSGSNAQASEIDGKHLLQTTFSLRLLQTTLSLRLVVDLSPSGLRTSTTCTAASLARAHTRSLIVHIFCFSLAIRLVRCSACSLSPPLKLFKCRFKLEKWRSVSWSKFSGSSSLPLCV